MSGKSTGNIFYIQLKGNDHKINNNTITYQLKRDHIDYYNSIHSPILLVLFSTEKKLFWGLWTNNLKEILNEEQLNQKTCKITLTEKHLINEAFFHKLQNKFCLNLPKKVNITFQSNDISGEYYHRQILKWLQFYFNDFIDINNAQLPSSINFKYKTIGNTLSVTIESPNNNFQLAPIDICDDSFLYLPIININQIPLQLNEILLVVSVLFQKYDVRKAFDLFTKTVGKYQGDLINPVMILNLIKLGVENDCLLEIQSLSEILINYKKFNPLQWLNMAILILNAEGKLTSLYQENLLSAINITEGELKGTLSYNLANSYRSVNKLYMASHYYQQARKLEPKYLERYYWWFEYAGVLFLSRHFTTSEIFYKKSYELNTKENVPLIYFLIADTLFFQGLFKEAKIYYIKYLESKSNEFLYGEAFLKSMVCENLLLAKLNSIKFNIEKSKGLTEAAYKKINADKLIKAIAAYPLNGLAWFNYGVYLKDNNDEKKAFTAFLTAACIQDWDREAWKNCFLISLKYKKMKDSLLIYSVMLDKHGLESVNYISEHILKYSNLNKEGKTKFINALADVAKSRQKP